MSINYQEFIHPSDRSAMEALKKVPGFNAIVKKFMSVFGEKLFKIENTSSCVKLGPKQMPRIYNILEKICQKLEIKTPELYLKLDRDINACTYGDTDIFIVVNSGLIESATDEQIETILAHECGHILCHHTLYSTMARLVLSGSELISAFINNFVAATMMTSLRLAFAYWMRCSEFSADRVSAYYHLSAEPVVDVMMTLAGATANLKGEFNREEFLSQAKDYKILIDSSAYNKVLEFYKFGFADHPLTCYRAYEIVEFYKKNKDIFDGYEQIVGRSEDPYLLTEDLAISQYNLRIWYEYIKPKNFFKLGGLFDNESLEISIAGIKETILKNSLSDLYLNAGEHEIVVKNSQCEERFVVNLDSNKSITIKWDSDNRKFSLEDR